MKMQNTELWKKIESYELTEEGCQISFEEKLAVDNGWTLGYANLVTAEYRKFIYLTQVAGKMVCPSDEVDQAWHLHITQTSSYSEFCKSVLNGFLHHYASKGGINELKKHQEMYAFTLSAYQEVFGGVPDAGLWPAVEERFSNFGKVDDKRDATWNQTMFISERYGLGFLLVVLFGLVISSMREDNLWPSVSGPLFVIGFSLAMIVIANIPRIFGKKVILGIKETSLDAFEAAYLVGGANRVFGTAITNLIGKGALKITAKRDEDKKEIKGAVCEKASNFESENVEKLHVIERELLEWWPQEVTSDMSEDAMKVIGSRIGDIKARLIGAGLEIMPGKSIAIHSVAVWMLYALALIGSMRFFGGIQQHHHVLILGILMVVLWIVLIYHGIQAGTISMTGRATVKELKAQYEHIKVDGLDASVGRREAKNNTGPALAFGFALFGSQAVMASEDFAGINWIVGNGNTTGNSGSSAGCGGSGSGCGGGGCGGGGCGGCGG